MEYKWYFIFSEYSVTSVQFQMQRVDSMSEVVYGPVSRSCTTRSHPGSNEGKTSKTSMLYNQTNGSQEKIHIKSNKHDS